ADDIVKATSGTNGLPDMEEAKRRSPFFMRTPVENRKKSTLYLYGGIHDGYTGSVPVSQTLHMYNKVVADFSTAAPHALVSLEHIATMLAQRCFPQPPEGEVLLGRRVL